MPPPRGLSCWNSAQHCNQVCCTDRKSIPSALPNTSMGTTFSLKKKKKDQICVRKHRNKNSVWRTYTHLVLQLLFPSWHPRGLMDLNLYNRHLRRIKELPQAFSTPYRQSALHPQPHSLARGHSMGNFQFYSSCHATLNTEMLHNKRARDKGQVNKLHTWSDSGRVNTNTWPFSFHSVLSCMLGTWTLTVTGPCKETKIKSLTGKEAQGCDKSSRQSIYRPSQY